MATLAVCSGLEERYPSAPMTVTLPTTYYHLKGNTTYYVLRPLSLWPFDPVRLSLRVWVKARPTFSQAPGLLGWALSGGEIEELQKRPYWLCCEFRDSTLHGTVRKQRAVEIIRNAALAIQIVAPSGSWDAQIITFEERNGDLAPISVTKHPPQHTVPWARIVGFDSGSGRELPLVVAGVQRAFARGGVRLKNALNFLDLGLEATNAYMQFFLWTTALGSLLMAGNGNVFRERAFNLFDPFNFVLPPIECGQPKYRVRDVIEDIYELRSAIAHGEQIARKFWSKLSFDDDTGQPIEAVENPRFYYEILQECSLFLLCRLLRWLFINGLDNRVRDTPLWRQELTRPHSAIP